MQSQATSVKDYLAGLPADRRAAIEAVRNVILKNLDKDYEEGMQYGMIGYFVPHRVWPAGYHCDPKQPLPFMSLASQKNHMALYMMCVYGDAEVERRFRDAWQKSGKKLDMGKSCLRFKKAEDLALDVIGATVKQVPVKAYLAQYQAQLAAMGPAREARKAAKGETAGGRKAGAAKKAAGKKAAGAKKAAGKAPRKAAGKKAGGKKVAGKEKRAPVEKAPVKKAAKSGK